MKTTRILTLGLFARLSSWVALLVVVVGICLIDRAHATSFEQNSLRGSAGDDASFLQPRPRIINGKDVEDLRYPYFSLMYGRSLCGGVLIGPRLVLGAAHCEDASDGFRIGAFEDTKDGQKVSIRDKIVHPKYGKSEFGNDIMIFQLEDTADHPYIRLEPENIKGGTFTVIGFGDTDKGTELQLSDELQEVELEYVNSDICDDGHGGHGQVTKDMMCLAGDDKDACIGDSGGPLIQKGSSIEDDKLVGVVSWGRGCAEEGVPGVYVRISYFYDWIVNTACDNFPDDAPLYMECVTVTDAPSRDPTGVPTSAPTSSPTEERTEEPTMSLFPSEDNWRSNETDAPSDVYLEQVELISWEGTELEECQGDCDTDDDCMDGLICFERDKRTQESFGCTGYEMLGQNVDVCINPVFIP